MPFLLDTNAVIAVLNDGASRAAVRLRRERPADVAVSAIVMHELFCGAHKSARADRNLALLDRLRFAVLEVGREDAREAGAVRAFLAGRGAPIGPFDVLHRRPGAGARLGPGHARHRGVRAVAPPSSRRTRWCARRHNARARAPTPRGPTWRT